MFRSVSDYTGVILWEGKCVQGSTYEFGPFTLDPAKRLLHRAGVNIAISPKGFDALVVLIEHRDRVVHKDELAAALWPDVAVQDPASRS